MVDAHFAVPRLAEIYDGLDPVRRDLPAYLGMADRFEASSVLDVGCGTGTFACLLARRGKRVVGVDPALASLEVARRKPGAEKVRWLYGDATTVGPLQVDLVTMTGNVAQVFVDDEDWAATLDSVAAVLPRRGRLVFETRDPAKKAWENWTREQTYRKVDLTGIGEIETWVQVTKAELPLVSFRTTFVFGSDGAILTSDSTLRFWSHKEIVDSLTDVGLGVQEVRDALDRPGLEKVYIAVRR